MRKASKNIILMITVLSLIGFYGIPNNISNEMPGDYNEMQTTIESEPLMPNSAESHAPIFINGSDPDNDWDDCDAVSGSGTIEEPYVIEDLEFDAGGSGSGIYIQDSTAYLNITNCTTINSGSGDYDAGLRIENCENITISNCIMNGIYLNNSTNNTLTGNTVANNSWCGIYFRYSSNNTLTGNMVANNVYSGIYLKYSSNNIVTGNTVTNHSWSGIYPYSSSSSTITGNTVSNSYYGIYLSSSSSSTITGNTVSNSNYGIYLYSSSSSTITGNTVANIVNSGIYLYSSHNTVTGNTVSNSNYGIYIVSSQNNTLTGNTVVNNSNYGIYFYNNCDDNDIFQNIIHANPTGIYIAITSSASIIENWIWDNADYDIYENGGEAKDDYPNNYYAHPPIFIDGDDPTNDWDDCDVVTGSGSIEDPYVIKDLEINAGGSGSGIYIRDSTAYLNITNCSAINSGSGSYDAGLRINNCENITISNCIMNNNSYYGIFLYYSPNNTLTGNTVSNNLDHGIRLYYSPNNTLTGNTFANNSYSGIHPFYSSNNILTGNIVANNTVDGIFLYHSSNNTLTGNTVSNSKYGIRLYYSSNNTLTDNLVADNSIYGIGLYSSSDDNDIFHNIIHTNPTGIEIESASSASIIENWIWDNADYDIYENGGEAKDDYPNNYYFEFCPLYDTDMDGLSDGEEFALHTNPFMIDTDNDNFLDGYEVLYGSDPLDPFDYPNMPSEWYLEFTALVGENTAIVEELWGWSNGNASLLLDMVEYLEGNYTLLETTYALAIQNVAYLSALEGNLEGNATEIRAVLDELGITIGDTDYDGLDDLDEVIYGTSLTCADTDCDNLNDAFEVKMGTDPLNDDTDGDSWLDGIESAAGTNPLDVTDYPGSDSSPNNNNTGLIIGGIVGSVAIFGTVTMVFVKRRNKKV